MQIQKKIVMDESNRPIAVQIDVETFAKIEQVLEDYALGQLIAEVEADESLGLEAAKAYYGQLLEEEFGETFIASSLSWEARID